MLHPISRPASIPLVNEAIQCTFSNTKSNVQSLAVPILFSILIANIQHSAQIVKNTWNDIYDVYSQKYSIFSFFQFSWLAKLWLKLCKWQMVILLIYLFMSLPWGKNEKRWMKNGQSWHLLKISLRRHQLCPFFINLCPPHMLFKMLLGWILIRKYLKSKQN